MASLRQLACTCAHAVRQPLRQSANRAFASTSQQFSTSPPSSSSPPSSAPPPAAPLPWFVDPSAVPPPIIPTAPKLATAPIPLPPPAEIPSSLHPLHAHLSVSPFLSRDAITFINAREADPESSWTDWIVICTLRRGREGGLRGAIEGVRSFLSTTPISLAPSPAPSPFSPPSKIPLITGLPTPPSKHARARAPSLSRAEQAVGWAMLDSGNVVVHVMTESARKNWDLEGLWQKVVNEGRRVAAIVDERMAVEDAEGEMEEPRYDEGEEVDSQVRMDGIEEEEMDKIA